MLVLLVGGALASCDRYELPDQPPPPPEPAAPAPPPSQAATPPATDPEPATKLAKPGEPQPPMIASTRIGFSKVVLEDKVPICVFASMADQEPVHFLADANKKQTLAADSSIAIGAYSPWCVNEACDDIPSLQCRVERDGNTLTVHSRYWGEHKEGSSCTENCRPVIAACPTPKLEAGKYTVKHGEKTFKLKIPSVLTDPCFGARAAAKKNGAAAKKKP